MSGYFDVNNTYEYYDNNTNQVTYLGSYVKSELSNSGAHGSSYYIYFNKYGTIYSQYVVIHPANPNFTNIRIKI